LKIFSPFAIIELLALEKNRVALKFFTALNILYVLRLEFLSNFAFALKNRGCREFTALNIYFLLFRIFHQLALALKNRVALKFFTVLNVLFTFRIFEQVSLALKNSVVMEFFTV